MYLALALAAIASLVTTTALGAPPPSTAICHVAPNRPTHLQVVPNRTVPQHLGHGDWRVGEEVCGDGIDNDCDGEIDEAARAAHAPPSTTWPRSGRRTKRTTTSASSTSRARRPACSSA